jgi:hypothetical protein
MSLAAKLQLKPGMTLASVGAPPDAPVIDAPEGDAPAADAVLLYARDSGELERGAGMLVAAASRRALAWIAYPKARQLGTDLSRDTIRPRVQAHGLDTVRQVALDDTWSALRLKRP